MGAELAKTLQAARGLPGLSVLQGRTQSHVCAKFIRVAMDRKPVLPISFL